MGRKWKPWQITYLRDWYGKKPIREMCVKLKRGNRAVRMKAFKLGLTVKIEAGRNATPEMYAEMVQRAALDAGIRPARVFGGDQTRAASHIRHRIWATLRDQGEGLESIAAVSGFDHGTVYCGIRGHRQRMAQMQVAE